ncbi:hypothetical protein UVI_02052610 [Ustilaginoidea virens]|uniref:Uncharacterized protein n=1 Tax=Ustilaginoidea virens TaxID=1159556 RepID=A0A1B5L5F6_USTVR|nr:hypothetical protein UVI_02052610 [Ustilaginoidea virens]
MPVWCHQFGPEARRAIADRERLSLGLHPTGMEWPVVWPTSDPDDDGDDDDDAFGGQTPSASIYKLVPSMQPYRNNLTALSQKYNVGMRPFHAGGWGILALANHEFLAVRSEEELLGAPLKDLEVVPKRQAGPHPMVSVAKYIRDLPENPCTLPGMAAAPNRPNNPVPHFGLDTDAAGGVAFMINQSNDGDDDFVDNSHSEFGDWEEQSEGATEEGNEDDGLVDVPEGDVLGGQDDLEVEEHDESDAMVHQGGGVSYPVVLENDEPLPLANEEGEAGWAELAELAELTELTTPVVEPPSSGSAPDESPLAQEVPSLAHLLIHLSKPPGGSSPPSESSAPLHASLTQCLKKLRPHCPPPCVDMVYMPHSAQVHELPRQTLPLFRFLRKPGESNENTQDYASSLGNVAERYHVLRMYEKDLEMRSLDKRHQNGLPEFDILCPYALTMGLSPGRTARPHFRATSRLSMVIHIPELCILAVGSPIGRVLILTPTRLEAPVEKRTGVLHHGLRIEWILPRQSDEAVFRVEERPLHGMAVGPVQEDGPMGDEAEDDADAADGRVRVAVPRRYRLMLHYRNHDVLTYEISREEQSGKLCIF